MTIRVIRRGKSAQIRHGGHRRMTSENNHDADQIYPVVRLYIQMLFINNFYVMYKKIENLVCKNFNMRTIDE